MVYVRTDCIYFIDFEALNYLPMTIYSIHAFVQTLENTESIMCSVQLQKKRWRGNPEKNNYVLFKKKLKDKKQSPEI